MEQMNKKGFVFTLPILIVGAVLVLLILGGVGFFASVNKFLVAGSAIIVMTFIYAVPSSLQGELTNRKIGFVLLLLFSGAFIIALPSLGLVEQTGFVSGHFEAPYFSTIKCQPAPGGRVNLEQNNHNIAGFIQCPVNSVDCDVDLTYPDIGFGDNKRRLEYYTCDDANFNNCGTPQYKNDLEDIGGGETTKINVINNLDTNKVLYAEFQRINFLLQWEQDDQDRGKLFLNYEPFVLWKKDSLGGGENPISGSTDCKIPTSSVTWKERITFSDVLSSNNQQADTQFKSKGIQNQLDVNEAYNYISGTVTRADAGNTIDYEGETAYCIESPQGVDIAQIYGIGTLETASNKYRIVDTNDLLGTEECCNLGKSELGRICEDFKWIDIKVEDEEGKTNIACSITNQCPVGRFKYSETEDFKYECISNFCYQKDIQTVECTENSQCGENGICLNFECTEASTEVTPKPDDKKTKDLDCSFYQKLVPANTETKKFLFFTTTTENEAQCKINPIFPLGLFLGVGFIIIASLLFTGGKKKKVAKGDKK